MLNFKTEKEKIAFVTYTLNSGGVSVCIFNLATYLAHRGYLVDIITINGKGIWFNKIEHQNIKFVDVSEKILKWIPFGGILHTLHITSVLRKEKYSSIFLNCAEQAHLALPLISSKTNVISIIHNNKAGVIRIGLINHQFINSIICVSPKVEEQTFAVLQSNKIETILNGVQIPDNKIYAGRSPIREQVKILFVGRLLNEQKGIFFIPQILKWLKEKEVPFFLTIIGDGLDKDKLIEMLFQFNLTENVQIETSVPNNEIYTWYFNSHIFLMPSFYEGLPLSLLEAMAAGCVPVTSRLDKITDVCIDDKITGFMHDVFDVESFAQSIHQLWANPQQYTEMSQLAMRKAQKEFSIDKMGEQYFVLLGKVPINRTLTNRVMGLIQLVKLVNIVPTQLIAIYNRYKVSKRR